jgi:hypothetical protein
MCPVSCVDVVKIVSLAADSDLVLATLGIAPFDLPVQTAITFEISRTQLPLKYLGRLKIDPQKLGDKAQGTVTLTYTQFRVNEGISVSE